jgi:hypothetical protein
MSKRRLTSSGRSRCAGKQLEGVADNLRNVKLWQMGEEEDASVEVQRQQERPQLPQDGDGHKQRERGRRRQKAVPELIHLLQWHDV